MIVEVVNSQMSVPPNFALLRLAPRKQRLLCSHLLVAV